MQTKVISAQGVRKVFNEGINNKVFVWQKNDGEVGYVPCYDDKEILFYNYAFFDPNLLKDNLGARMMLQAVLQAKQDGKKYIYLGSSYYEGSLYKTEFKGAEFFNGLGWSDDIKELKYLIRELRLDQEYILRNDEYIKKFQSERKISEILLSE